MHWMSKCHLEDHFGVLNAYSLPPSGNFAYVDTKVICSKANSSTILHKLKIPYALLGTSEHQENLMTANYIINRVVIGSATYLITAPILPITLQKSST